MLQPNIRLFARCAVHTTNPGILLTWAIIEWDRKEVSAIWWSVPLLSFFSRVLFVPRLQSISLGQTVENIKASKRMTLMNWTEAGLISLCGLAQDGRLGFVFRNLRHAAAYAAQLLAIIRVVYGRAVVFISIYGRIVVACTRSIVLKLVYNDLSRIRSGQLSLLCLIGLVISVVVYLFSWKWFDVFFRKHVVLVYSAVN